MGKGVHWRGNHIAFCVNKNILYFVWGFGYVGIYIISLNYIDLYISLCINFTLMEIT